MTLFNRKFVFIFLFAIFGLLVTNFAIAADQVCEPAKLVIFGCDVGQMLNLNAEQLTLSIVVIAGLVDGINPCAIGLIILLLGYLIVFVQPEKGDDKKKFRQILKIGAVYIATVFVTYLLIGIFFYKFIDVLVTLPYFGEISSYLKYVLAFLIIIAGLINIKDYFWHGKGPSLEIPQSQRMKLTKYIQKATIPSTIVLGVLVTLFELPCSLPLYVGSVDIMHDTLDISKVVLYLFIYNILFVLPLIVIWLLVLGGKRIAELKEWQEAKLKTMKLVMGIVLVLMGVILILL